MNNFAEIEQSVKELYQPTTPARIDHLQKQLQDAQRAHGWALANELMGSDDQNVRFFAALTFTVKINQEGSSLGEDDLQSLLSTLINWLLLIASQNEAILVLRKMCSALVTFFLLPNSNWKFCVRHIICCISAGTALAEDQRHDNRETSQVLKAFTPRQLFIVIMFVKNLAEDAARIEHKSQLFDYCHQRTGLNVVDTVAVLNHALDMLLVQQCDFPGDIFQCYQSWIIYIRQEHGTNSDQLQILRTLIGKAVQCLFVENLFEDSAEFFTDVFSSGEAFFLRDDTSKFSTLLQLPWAINRLATLQHGQLDDECVQFAQVIAAFAQANAKFLIQEPVEFQHVTEIMHRITAAQQFETLDQHLANGVIDFWEAYVSHAPDVMSEKKESQLFTNAKCQWLNAIDELCTSTILPQNGEGDLVRLGTDHPFAEYRWRVQSAVHSSYEIFEVAILEMLVSLAVGSGVVVVQNTLDWPRIEAVFNCLAGLAEPMEYQSSDIGTEDEQLQRLFSSPTYSTLTDFTVPVPIRLRKRAIALTGEHDVFLGRHPEYLLSALDMLFGSLQQPTFAESAARAVYTLCNANRKILASKLETLLSASEHFFDLEELTHESKNMIVAAIAAVTQSLESIRTQTEATERLLTFIERDYHSSRNRQELKEDGREQVQSTEMSALGQLKAIGKAWQSPDNEPIDLDEVEQTGHDLWSATQGRVIVFLRSLTYQSLDNGDIVEALCEVLRSGYREKKPGPFVFSPQVTIDLVIATNRSTPRLDMVLRTAATFISSRGQDSATPAVAVSSLLNWLSTIVDSRLASEDPETAEACIEFLSRLLPRHLYLFGQLSPQTINAFITLPNACLAGAEVLPKRAAASFWTSMLSVSDTTLQPLVSNILAAYGTDLVRNLIFNYGGNAARSELDSLTEPLRKLIFKHSHVPWKSWMEQALLDPAFPSTRVTHVEKRRFVAQVERLRGDRKTNSVVREFWLACRGTPVAYG